MKKFFYVSVFFILGYLQANATIPIACTMDYAPVCGAVAVECITAPCGPVQQTFSNNCMARASKAINITDGECATITPPVIA